MRKGIIVPTVDFTLEDLKQVFATKNELDAVKVELKEDIAEVKDSVNRIKDMLEDDFRAEARRVDGIDRRLTIVERQILEPN